MDRPYIAFKARGKEEHPDIPKGAIVHLYHHGDFTKCGIKLDEHFVIDKNFIGAKITCKECAGSTKEGAKN